MDIREDATGGLNDFNGKEIYNLYIRTMKSDQGG
jgi:hypothetical protein